MTRHACSLAILFLTICLACVQPAEAEEQAQAEEEGWPPPTYAVSNSGQWKVRIHEAKMIWFQPCTDAGKLALGSDDTPVRLLDLVSGQVEAIPDSTGWRVAGCAPDASFVIFDDWRNRVVRIHDRTAGKTVELPKVAEYSVVTPDYPSSLLSPDGTRMVGPSTWGEALTLPSGRRITVVPYDAPSIWRSLGVSQQGEIPFGKAFWSLDSKRVLLKSGGNPKPTTITVVDADRTGREPFSCLIPDSEKRGAYELFPLTPDSFVINYSMMHPEYDDTFGVLRLQGGQCKARDMLIVNYGVSGTGDGKIIYSSRNYACGVCITVFKIVDENLETVEHAWDIDIYPSCPVLFTTIRMGKDRYLAIDNENHKAIFLTK